MKNEHVILKSASSRVTLNVAKGLAFLFALMLSLTACSDYEADYEDMYGYLVEAGTDVALSSSLSSSWSREEAIGSMTDLRDNQVYKTVTIGTQTWMAENLNYETGNSWCYDDKTSNCDKYGRLYTWSAVMDSAAQFSVNAGTKCGYGKTCTPNSPHRGICPEGWHVPTNKEYSTLYTYIGGSSTAGSMLKSTSGWCNGGNGSDKYGFSVLPAGDRSYSGNFGSEGYGANLWSASEYGSSVAWYQDFYYYDDYAYQFNDFKYYGRSLRCLKDSSPTSGEATSSSSQAQPSSSSSTVIPDPDRGSSSSVASSSSVNDGYDAVAQTLTDSRDGQTYKTVSIGTQTWMAENLNYSTSGSYCYGNNASNCDKYGRLYVWSAAMNACPSGWHLPDDDEWNSLWTAVGGTGTAGTKLKSKSGWNSNGNGSDSFGFAVLPAGYRYDGGYFYGEGYDAYFWSSTEDDSYDAYYWYFEYRIDGVNRGNFNKDIGFSVRCLWDSSLTSDEATSSSSVASSSSAKSSSSVVSSSSEKSSSSVASSSSAKSSSSFVSSSSVVSSSSSMKSAWAYLNQSVSYGEFVDSRDSQVYKTVTIGTQTWMAENLNYSTSGSYCYGDNASNCDKYGRLYVWSAAMNACPSGWHLPDDDEWNTLWTAVGGTGTAGTKLKSKSGWYNNGNGTDTFGFAVLPAGYRGYSGSFYNEGDYAFFWSSTEYSSVSAYHLHIYDGSVRRYDNLKDNGFSVRCLWDSN